MGLKKGQKFVSKQTGVIYCFIEKSAKTFGFLYKFKVLKDNENFGIKEGSISCFSFEFVSNILKPLKSKVKKL